MVKDEALQILLSRLLPANMASCYSASLPPHARLMPDELIHTGAMVEKRLAEFTHGRYCARQAMQELGVSAQVLGKGIGKGESREPLWPAGVTGSITHTDSAAAAVVALTKDFRSIGLDMELPAPLQPELIDMICLPQENPQRNGDQAKLLFSIKEAIFKCLHPVVGTYIDFLEMHVQVDMRSNTFAAGPLTNSRYASVVAKMNGSFAVDEKCLLSAAWLNH